MAKRNYIWKVLSLAISLMMVAMFFLSNIKPVKAEAADLTVSQIKTQITSTYATALANYKKKTGNTSFDGLCGDYVKYQLETLGISANSELSGNGNTWWSKLSKMKQTSKGYNLTLYSGKNCINNIVSEKNGKNVYNIVVAFSKGYGSLGATYGHVLFIHAIIDGTIYFSESFDWSSSLKEGSVIAWSVSNFYSKYSNYTFDGAAILSTDTKNSVTIHYNTNGGTIASDSDYYAASNGDIYKTATKKIHEQVMEKGTTNPNGLYNASTFKLSRTGYKFLGWSLSKSGGTVFDQDDATVSAKDLFPDIDTKSGTVLLYAIWKANSYTVTFDASGGTVSDSKKTVTYGSTYGTLPTASRTGYTFDGWYTAASGGTKITADSKVSITANQTLYAHWKANSYTVTFDSNGGTMSDSKTSVTYGSAYGTLPTPSRAGYVFMGWYTEASGGTNITADSNVETAKDHILYAQWKVYKGDCDEDGELTENDLVMLQKWLLGSEELTNGQNADMNDDGNVDVFDMVELRRLFVLSNTSISLNVTSKAMITGDTFDLIATVSPENSVVEWSSSDTKIATVTDGKVKALSEGTAVIYASIDSGAGKVTVECKVTVSSPTIKLSSTSGSSSDTYIYKTNNNFYSMVVKLPTYTTNISGTVKWSVVSGDAVISGDKLCINQPGTITARASITYNGKTYSEDYTYKRTQEFTADIPYNLRSKPSLSNSTILDSMPKGTKLTVSLIDYNDSTYVWGKVTYNNTTGYVLLWSKDGSDGGIKVV